MLRYLGDKNHTERLKELGMPTLEYRCQTADLLQSYRLLNNIDLSTKILKIENSRSTRGNKFKLYKERFNTEIRRSTFSNKEKYL